MADAVRCEACNKHADRPAGNYNLPGHWPTLPAGWLRVGVVETNDPALVPGPSAEVCSWPCAAGWMEDEAAKHDEFRCDSCGKTVAEHGPTLSCNPLSSDSGVGFVPVLDSGEQEAADS